MGCDTSAPNVSQSYDNNIQANKIPTKIRQQILQAIENDDAMQFVLLLDQFNVPLYSQLSQSSINWLTIHYCCRWDSSTVLDTILKTEYAMNPKNYISFVNAQTIEGYTCLHLCAIQGSIKCFEILIKFGGLNLKLKDKRQSTPYSSAAHNKRDQMKQFLSELQGLRISFLNVRHEELIQQQLLTSSQQKKVHHQKPLKEYFNALASQKSAKLIVKNLIAITPQQQNILTEKKRIQEEKQKLREQMKKQQFSQAQIYAGIKNQPEIKNPKKQIISQTNSKFEQIKHKQNQLSELKKSLKKVQQIHLSSKIQRQKKKLAQYAQKHQQKFQQRVQYTKQVVKQHRQSLEMVNKSLKGSKKHKRDEQIPSFIRPEAAAQDTGECPQELKEVYEKAKRAGIFIDKEFPQHDSSIGNSTKFKNYLTQLAWLRPDQFFKGEYFLFDGIDPDDIKQGSLGVCYMLATLSVLAQYPERIKKIFVFHDKSIGFYVLRMNINGVPKYVVIDDAIPCDKYTKWPLFSKPHGNQLWVCLVEKAWCKCIGSYQKAQAMTPNFLMQDITTCPSSGGWFKDKLQKTKQIDIAVSKGYVVVLTSLNGKKIQGIVNDHAYSLLQVYELNGKNIYKIRNPWGNFEWNGIYGDSSHVWTEQLKRTLNYVDKDDGVFFVSESQLLEAFVYYSICYVGKNDKYSFINFEAKKDENRYYTFQLDSEQQIGLRFVQKFIRMVNDPNYQYSPIILQVGKIEDNGSVKFLTEGSTSNITGGKSLNADLPVLKKYQKGNYFVRVCVKWVKQQQYNTGVLAISGEKQIKIKQINNQIGQIYWIELAKNFAFTRGKLIDRQNFYFIMSWMRAQLICLTYAKQSQQSNNLQSKWIFDPSSFVNCNFELNYMNNQLRYTVGKGRQKANIGTIKRNVLAQMCTAGSTIISVIEKMT